MEAIQAFQTHLETNSFGFAVEECMNDLNVFFEVTSADPEKVELKDVQMYAAALKANNTLTARAMTTLKFYIDFVNQTRKPSENPFRNAC
jgi:hypothetical protein